MIYLNPPFPVINGVSLMPDHQDPNWFYFFPLAPRITQLKDATTGNLVPQMQLLKFRGAAGNGGFLNFDCNIGVDGNVLDDVAEELKRSLHLTRKPTLGQIPVVDGTVRLLLLGASTPDTPPPGKKTGSGGNAGASASPAAAASPATAGPKFVTHIDQAAHPALYADNQAVFSVSLDAAGATVLRSEEHTSELQSLRHLV